MPLAQAEPMAREIVFTISLNGSIDFHRIAWLTVMGTMVSHLY
jgi:hypothetical protein